MNNKTDFQQMTVVGLLEILYQLLKRHVNITYITIKKSITREKAKQSGSSACETTE